MTKRKRPVKLTAKEARQLARTYNTMRVKFNLADGTRDCLGVLKSELSKKPKLREQLEGKETLELCAGGSLPAYVFAREWFVIEPRKKPDLTRQHVLRAALAREEIEA